MKKFKIGILISLVGALVLFSGIVASADEFSNVGGFMTKPSVRILSTLIFIQKQTGKKTKYQP